MCHTKTQLKPLLRLGGLFCALLIVGASLGFAQISPGSVAKIEVKHVGPQAVSDQLIRANIRVKVGDPYVPTAVDEDVRNLYATGFFYNIRVTEDRTRDGVILTYIVQGKPRLTDLKFSGNKKFSDAKLRKKLTSKVGEPLDEHKLFNDSQEIQKLYQKSGYPNTEVKYVLNIDEPAGRGTATFEIKESPKVKIQDVRFAGAQAVSQKKLRKTIKTRRHWMFSWLTGSGVLKEDQFEDDKEKLAEFYRDKGYIDFEIKDVKFEYPTPGTMVIKFIVFEGNPYKVGAVGFKGAPMFPTNKVDQVMRLKVGATFKPKDLAKDVEKIEDFYGAKGHIDVTEGSGNLRVNKIPNIEKGTMDLEYQITEGQKSYIEKIEIRGNAKTKDRVIRRELAVSPGETFDMVRVKLSKARLEGLQYFEKVDLKPEPTDIAPNRKNLIVGVEEKSTGNIALGAGFNSIENLMGFVDVSQGNFDLFNPPTFTGGGQKARLHLALGTQQRDVAVTFIEPWFLDRKLSLGVELYHRWLDYESVNNLYTETRTGGRLSLTKALWRDSLIGSVSYTLEDIGILLDPSLHGPEKILVSDPYTGRPVPTILAANAPQALLAENGHSLLSRVGASLAYDTRNSVLLPDKGQRTELFGEVTGGPFGGDKSYYKLELRNAWYLRGLAKGHVLELTAQAGVATAFGNTQDVPFYDRYYLGGLYTLRGYRYRDIGPKELVNNTELEPVGGGTYWFGSAEYSVPIIERVRLAAFYDIGMVYPKAFSFAPQHFFNPSTGTFVSTGTYADNWGFGIRLNLPIGPLRLDYGLPLTHDPSVSGSGRFQFGVGYTRQF